ncbi:hypothetical protein C0J52_08977 [Blattella germanica]|nr:hypothetical protein C0J52_08977 [Blattella germanica]
MHTHTHQNSVSPEPGGGNPFQNIEKTTVLQEARTFNETPLNPRKCTHILTKILYLLNQQLGTTEATEAFFAMTKLFQSRDVILRRMQLGTTEATEAFFAMTKLFQSRDVILRRMIRIACKLLEEEDTPSGAGSSDSPLFEFIESCLRHKSEMVIYEAAHAIVNLRRTTHRELVPAVSVLQLFCSSPKPTLRFAAVRTLNKVAMSHPNAVTACLAHLCEFIEDCEHTSLAVRILHLLGKEGPRTKQPSRYIRFIYNRVILENAPVRAAAVAAMSQFGATCPDLLPNIQVLLARCQMDTDDEVRDRATYYYSILERQDKPLSNHYIVEGLQDCEHTSLAVRILHLLGKEGPRTKQPSRYIRFIYNRVILENAPVRAAAVAAMSQFGATCPDLLPNIQVLLARCQMDTDDEVRDRATYYYSILERQDKPLSNHYIVEGLQVSIPSLERALQQYTMNPTDVPFDMKSVPLAAVPSAEEIVNPAVKGGQADGMLISATLPGAKISAVAATVSREESYAEKLRSVPELMAFGPLFRSSEPVELTESETEYVVRCVKHCFPQHLVLQVEPPDGYQLLQEIPCTRLPYSETGTTYAVLQFPEELGATVDEAVKNIISFLGMQPAERSDRVAEGKSSHTLFLAGELHCK